VLFIGDCTECSEDLLARWERLRRQGYAVYVVTSSGAAEVEKLVAASGLKLPVLLEQSHQGVSEQYNAAFRPRAYVVDAAGKIVYAQPEQVSGDVVLRDVTAHLARLSHPGRHADSG
jgi:peroxiredoxin